MQFGNSARIGLASIALILLPLTAPAQNQAEVEQALRARVTEFLQYHVDGNFRKAYDIVAEDTKDDYFAAGKARLTGFKVGEITFSDNFTKAKVNGTISKVVNVAGTDIPVELPSITTWKIEDGKWVWYKEPTPSNATILGVPIQTNSAAAQPSGNSSTDPGLPKDLNDKAVAAAAQSILQQVSVDKKEITLAVDKASEDKVVFHNGMTGSVQITLTVPEIPGFTAKVDQAIVRASSDVPVMFHYEPGQVTPKGPVTVQIWVQPLNQVFAVQVKFSAAN